MTSVTIATAILAFFTFLLAIAAFINILLTRRIQAKERKDRQLREVANWAVDVVKAPFLVETTRGGAEVTGFLEAEVQAFLRRRMTEDLTEEARQITLILASGEYIKNLAGHLDRSLGSAVENILRSLTEYHNLIGTFISELHRSSGDPRDEYSRLIAPTLRYWHSVQDSAKAIISQTTELLVK